MEEVFPSMHCPPLSRFRAGTLRVDSVQKSDKTSCKMNLCNQWFIGYEEDEIKLNRKNTLFEHERF